MREPPIRCFKLTDDEWWPSYKVDGWHFGVKSQKLVHVSFLQFHDESGWRCCVWGADDFGLDFDSTVRSDVWNMWLLVMAQEKLTVAWLREMGFVNV